ncbi:unnamed protein product [Protopolystoma xenopodis]|uniref:Uncharacterized protein n=1 Tax=Protopolystoma xenopodis TaxID=117903 RepID=A0A3S5B852_9PLAT|nr:unnamed protein product [Protopolystoma xenopodis]
MEVSLTSRKSDEDDANFESCVSIGKVATGSVIEVGGKGAGGTAKVAKKVEQKIGLNGSRGRGAIVCEGWHLSLTTPTGIPAKCPVATCRL